MYIYVYMYICIYIYINIYIYTYRALGCPHTHKEQEGPDLSADTGLPHMGLPVSCPRLERQYLYFCTSKASTFALAKRGLACHVPA